MENSDHTLHGLDLLARILHGEHAGSTGELLVDGRGLGRIVEDAPEGGGIVRQGGGLEHVGRFEDFGLVVVVALRPV